MEEIMNFLGHRAADPGHRLDIGHAGRRHRPGRAEMLQQGLLAARADAGDLVQRIDADRLAALLAMAAYGEAVRLVAQALQVVEHRALGIEAERLPARHVEMFTS